MAEDEITSLPPDPMAEEDLIAATRRQLSCLVVQNPDFFGHLRDLSPAGRGLPGQGRAAHRRGHRNFFARPGEVSRRHGRGYCRRRGPVDRQWPEFRRPLCRPLRHPRKIRAPDAGPSLRPDAGLRKGGAASCSPFRRANSTSAATRRPPTSAPIRASARWPFTIHLSLLGETGLEAARAASTTPMRSTSPRRWKPQG